jgi:outer membrane protein OmpA-like peptidoglycan-associated protein
MKSATQVDMPGAIDFKTGTAKIDMNDGTKKTLAAMVDLFKQNPDIGSAAVEGHTDNAGEAKGFDNIKLSQARADAIVDYLSKNGVDKSKLLAFGRGSTEPLAPNDSPEHMALNRRVEVHLCTYGGQPVGEDQANCQPTAASTASTATPATSASAATDSSKPKTPPTKPKK